MLFIVWQDPRQNGINALQYILLERHFDCRFNKVQFINDLE